MSDILLFGATGVVGRLTARHLAGHDVILAGRDVEKLRELRDEINPAWEIATGDAHSADDMAALAARAAFSALVQEAGHGPVVTEVRPFDEAAIEAAVEAAIEAAVAAARADGATDSAEDDAAAPQVIADGIGEGGHPGPGAPFYLAEDDHQQYLDARPWGYCNHGPNGLTCQIGLLRQDETPAQTSIVPPSE